MSGLYVASNVPAIGAQINLLRTQSALTDVLTRLTTGLKINSGKDDPAGLIASELLKSDISATEQAITNTQRANSMIAVADSALGQVSSLLNDIRTLVNEGANTGAMSSDQIAANQLQIDATLDSIDRIANTTNFQGQKLLDGSLDFTTAGIDYSKILDLEIESANFGTQKQIDVSIKVIEKAETAKLIFDQGGISESVVLEIGGSQGSQVFKFEAGADVNQIAESVNMLSDSTGVRAVVGREATKGQLYITSAGQNNDINLVAKDTGYDAGNYSIKFTAGNSNTTDVKITEGYGGNPGTIEFMLQMQEWANASAVGLSTETGGNYSKSVQFGGAATDLLGLYSDSGIEVKTVEFIQSNRAIGGNGKVAAELDSNGVLHIEYKSDATGDDIVDAINAQIKGLNAVVSADNAVTATGNKATIDANIQLHGAVANGDLYKNTATWLLGDATNGISISFDGQLSQASAVTDYIKGIKMNVDSGLAAPSASFDANSGILTLSVNGTSHDLDAIATQIQTALQASFSNLVTVAAAGAGATVVDGSLGGTAPGLSSVAGTAGAIGAKTATITPAGNNSIDITARIAGSAMNSTDVIYIVDPTLNATAGATTPPVKFDYYEQAQKASTMFMIGAGAGQMTFNLEAKNAGSALNGTFVRMESDSSITDGSVKVVWNSELGELHIRGNFDTGSPTSYADLMSAVTQYSDFKLTINDATGKAVDGSTKVTQLATGTAVTATVGATPGTIGTDNGALIIRLGTTADGSVATANDVVNSFNSLPENKTIAGMFTITHSAGSNGSGQMLNIDPFLDAGTANPLGSGQKVYMFSKAITGGTDGWQSTVTANELMDFIRNHEQLSQMFDVEKLPTSTGEGLLTLFEEYAYYGDVNAQNMLQFLGPKDSKSIEFIAGDQQFANQDLQLVWSADVIGYARTYLNATNANASIQIEAITAGDEYDDMAVRFIRLDNNYTADDSYATYTAGPSNSMAYCSINDSNTTGTNTETGKFIIYSTENSDRYNNTAIQVRVDGNQTDEATTTYNEDTKTFTITLNSANVALGTAMDAINRSGLFTADFDYSNNANPNSDPGIETFNALIGTNTSGVFTIGNTGTTGGHTGGVLNVYIGGNDTEVTAQNAINAINNSATTKNKFNASNYAGSSGTGKIDFRNDTLTTAPDDCGTVPASKVVTYGGMYIPGTMQIYLATDAYGNSITTAKDIVDYFDQLTAEETRGVSVSLVRPPGVDNVPDDYCVDGWGSGIVKPNIVLDEPCEVDPESYALQFHTVGEDIRKTNPYGDVIAVNGVNASYRVYAKEAGSYFEGVGLRYILLTEDDADVHATFDNGTINVYVRNTTTALDVKNAIESSDGTKNLFTVDLLGDGSGTVTLFDDAMYLEHGTYNAGYVGGVAMLGNLDDDPHRLTFESVNVGSGEYVTVRTVSGKFSVKNEDGQVTDADYGKDMVATLNGNSMTAHGNDLRLSSTMLTMNVTLSDDVQEGEEVDFTITGGGATFQIGPDVVSSQQVRLGIQSVNTARLGGVSGKLYMLRDGEVASLRNDTKLADRIVQEAISSIASLRGRLGAIQRSTFEPNIAVLQDTIEQLSAAQADIADADYAQETSNLARYQILMQAGASALATANQFPQYAAMLLG